MISLFGLINQYNISNIYFCTYIVFNIFIGGWCWILGTTTAEKVYRWVCFYGQLVIIFIFCLYTYIRIYIFLNYSEKGKEFATRVNKLYHRIKWYPLCLILGYGVSTFKRFYELFGELPYTWSVLQTITTGLFGFFILLVYGNIGKLNKLFCPKCYKNMKAKHSNGDTNDDNNESNSNDDNDNQSKVDTVVTIETARTDTGTGAVNEMKMIRQSEQAKADVNLKTYIERNDETTGNDINGDITDAES